VAYATTRFRLPLLPVAFIVGAAALVGRGDGVLTPLRGWRVGLLAVLVGLAAWVLTPGIQELLVWQWLTGR
jgi:hypothetical protein